MPSASPPLPSLDHARGLRAAGSWTALVQMGERAGEERLLEEPELAFLFALACRVVGRPGKALEVAGRVEPLARRRGDRWLLAEVVNLLGIALWETGRVDDAEARFAELLEAAAEWHDEESSARASNNLGVLANVRGRRDLALSYYQRALASYHRLGNVRGVAETHHNLGISYRDLGFDREADHHYGRAVELAEGGGIEDVVALAETERAMLRARAGDGRLAAQMGRRALARFRALSDPTGAAQAIRVLAAAARAEGEDDAAERHLDEALAIAREHSDALLHAEVQRDRGMLLRDRGDRAGAREALLDSVARFEQIGAAAEAEAVRLIAAGLDGAGEGG